MGLFYECKNRGIGLGILKSTVPEDHSFTAFSDCISRDTRIPSKDQTKVGYKVGDDTVVNEFRGARIWAPHQGYENTAGIALMPRILLEEGWMKDVYAYAFQGRDLTLDSTFISGLKGYGEQYSPEMKLVLSGLDVSSSQLERAAKTFFNATGLNELEFHEHERDEFDRGHEKILDVLAKHNFHRNGIFMYIALFAAEVGDKISQASSIRIE